jgi:hypothetical protein
VRIERKFFKTNKQSTQLHDCYFYQTFYANLCSCSYKPHCVPSDLPNTFKIVTLHHCNCDGTCETDSLFWKHVYRWSPVSAVYCGPKKFGKLKKWMVHKFQNAHQVRTGCNMVKSSSPNVPSTWLIFLCLRTHASLHTWHHSASSVLTVRISCHVIAVFVFRNQQEEWRNQRIPTID